MEKLYTVSKNHDWLNKTKGFPGRSMIKNLPANAGDVGFITGLGEKEIAPCSSILAWKISGFRGAWWATVLGVAEESDTT